MSKRKKKINEKIRKIDIILQDNEKISKEYENRNKGLPLSKKIFSKKVLRNILANEREEYFKELKKCNDKMNYKNFIKIKKEYEYEYQYLILAEVKEIDCEIENRIILLQKRVLQALKLNAKNSNNRDQINNIIYEIRYFNMLPFDSKTKIKEVSKLKKMITTTMSVAIEKAYELKSFNEIFKDVGKNADVLKNIFKLKVIRLEDIKLKIIKEKDEFFIQFFDDDVLDEKIKLDMQINKKDLKIRFNRKIKVFDL